MDELRYLSGFGNDHATEATPGALPVGRNSPQRPPLGLYPEQLNGTAFTAMPHENKRSWLYRILPSVKRSAFKQISTTAVRSGPFDELPATPDQLRWDPWPLASKPTDFVAGLTTICGAGSVEGQTGCAIHVYAANKSMGDRCFYNADGELLVIPQLGQLLITTEFGRIAIGPQEVAVIPRGVVFHVDLKDKEARGYVCENYGLPFGLPWRGPIGANGLANGRDFETPVAWYEDRPRHMEVIAKFGGRLFAAEQAHSPFNVVGWHGNYAPYKYDLRRFNTVNSVSFDHPDPSIFTVLTSPSLRAGTANVDFVIFPPRWMVAEDTFRPPYFHRNIMSEYMGLIHGVYDAKPAGGFEPGGGSLHNCMSPHGPEAEAFEKATEAALKPQYLGDTMAFMLETSLLFKPTKAAMDSKALQKNYLACWQGLKPHFGPARPSK